MPELLSVLNAIYEKEKRYNKFMASIQGIDLDSSENKNNQEEEVVTLEDVYANAMRKAGASYSESEAIRQGFTPDMGIAYEVIGDV